MPNKKFIEELKELLRLRGKVSKAQVEYTRVEEKARIQMYPITKPSEEKRSSHLRTLESYIGENALKVTG
jgi:hypothetical protein